MLMLPLMLMPPPRRYDFFADVLPHADRFGRPFKDQFVFYKGDGQGIAGAAAA